LGTRVERGPTAKRLRVEGGTRRRLRSTSRDLTADKYVHADRADKQAAVENLPSFGLAQGPEKGKKKTKAKKVAELPVVELDKRQS